MARQRPAPWVWPRNCERTVCKATTSSTRFPPLAENAAVCSASASRAPPRPPSSPHDCGRGRGSAGSSMMSRGDPSLRSRTGLLLLPRPLLVYFVDLGLNAQGSLPANETLPSGSPSSEFGDDDMFIFLLPARLQTAPRTNGAPWVAAGASPTCISPSPMAREPGPSAGCRCSPTSHRPLPLRLATA